MTDDDRWPWPRAGNAILALSLLSWALAAVLVDAHI